MTPLLLSAFVAPGAGQIYKKRYARGFLILGLCLLGFALLFVDLVVIVNAHLAQEPLTEFGEIPQRAMEIREGIDLTRFTWPVALIVVSYVWGVVDAWLMMRREKQESDGQRVPDDELQVTRDE